MGPRLRRFATDEGAELTLGLFPDEISKVHPDVTGAILPKTLFGQKYVSLVPGESDEMVPDGGRLALKNAVSSASGRIAFATSAAAQQGKRRGGGAEHLEVEVHLIERKRDVLVGFGLDLEFELLLAHAAWQHDNGSEIRHESSICKTFVAEAVILGHEKPYLAAMVCYAARQPAFAGSRRRHSR